MKLKDKVAIVTGSGRGLGREMALALAGEDANLVVVQRTRQDLEVVAQEIRALGGKALAIPTDITVAEQVNGMVQKALEEFGRIDILVNNAGGVFNTFHKLVIDLDPSDWREALDINVTGTFLCSRAVLPHMIKQRSGIILNVSSGFGRRGRPGASAYTAAKFAIEGFTQEMHLEVSPFNIRVNAFSPGGAVATPGMLKYMKYEPPDRVLDPKIIRELLIYLASDDSIGVSGQSFIATTWNADKREINSLIAESQKLRET